MHWNKTLSKQFEEIQNRELKILESKSRKNSSASSTLGTLKNGRSWVMTSQCYPWDSVHDWIQNRAKCIRVNQWHVYCHEKRKVELLKTVRHACQKQPAAFPRKVWLYIYRYSHLIHCLYVASLRSIFHLTQDQFSVKNCYRNSVNFQNSGSEILSLIRALDYSL